MQLPRGTFREIKKSELASSILDELERTGFTGICSISSIPVSGTLVFKSGRCILAKIQHKSGDGAWDEIQKKSDQVVDAALSSLDEAQVQLALEFNKASRILKGINTTPAITTDPTKKHIPIHHGTVTSVKPDTVLHKAAHTAQPVPGKTVTPSHPVRAQITPHHITAAQPSLHKPVLHTHLEHKPENLEDAEGLTEGPSNFEKDIDTFDALDLDNVTDKIRNDCKTMIKQLHLEHLMER